MNTTKKSFLTKIAEFFFGKPPQIFDAKGNVRHEFPKEKWDAWNRRYFSSPEMNWRNHTGTKARPHK